MLKKFNTNMEIKKILSLKKVKKKNINTKQYLLADLIFKDMMFFTKI